MAVVILGGRFHREIVALKSVILKLGRSIKRQNFLQAGMFRRALVGEINPLIVVMLYCSVCGLLNDAMSYFNSRIA